MPMVHNGVQVGRPARAGHLWNAVQGGRLVWPDPADVVVGVEVLAVDGGKPPTSLPVDGTVELAARATYGDGHVGEVVTEGVAFASLDTTVATVSGNTVRWAHGGTALITAKIGGFTSAAISIGCAYAPESIRVTDADGTVVDSLTMRVGDDPVRLLFSVLPAQADQTVTVSVDDPTIVSVTRVLYATGFVSLDGWTDANPNRAKIVTSEDNITASPSPPYAVIYQGGALSRDVPCVAGEPVTLEVRVHSMAAGRRLRVLDGSSEVGVLTPSTVGAWELLSLTFTPTGEVIRLGLDVPDTALRVDDLTLTQSEVTA